MGKFINNNDIRNNNINNDTTEQHSEYSDHIYVAESKSKEQLYDRNNPIVKMILIILGSIAFFGTLYYILTAIGII